MFAEQLPFLSHTLFLTCQCFPSSIFTHSILSLIFIHPSSPPALLTLSILLVYEKAQDCRHSLAFAHTKASLSNWLKEECIAPIQEIRNGNDPGYGHFSEHQAKEVSNSLPWKWLLTNRNHWKNLRLPHNNRFNIRDQDLQSALRQNQLYYHRSIRSKP